MFRLTGAAPPARWSQYAHLFRSAATSLRALSGDERRTIRVTRLAVATARNGEGLERLSRRVGNRWSLQETAVANDLDEVMTLRRAQQVKVAVDAEIAE
jgi:predicted Zn-dependent protease